MTVAEGSLVKLTGSNYYRDAIVPVRVVHRDPFTHRVDYVLVDVGREDGELASYPPRDFELVEESPQ